MKINKAYILLVILIFSLGMVSCDKNKGEEVPFINSTVFNTNELLGGDEKEIIKITSVDNLTKYINKYGITNEYAEIYNQKYFDGNVLLFVAFGTTPEPKYTVKKLRRKENKLIIFVDSKTSRLQNDLLTGIGILIEIPEKNLLEITSYDLEFKTKYID